jgi:hypothetical protein
MHKEEQTYSAAGATGLDLVATLVVPFFFPAFSISI